MHVLNFLVMFLLTTNTALSSRAGNERKKRDRIAMHIAQGEGWKLALCIVFISLKEGEKKNGRQWQENGGGNTKICAK